MKIKTVILKLSGESLGDSKDGTILNSNKLKDIVFIVKSLKERNINVGIVTGAGNIFRGRIAEKIGINQETGDYMGMIGTVINCSAIADLLNKDGIKSIVLSSLEVEDVAKKYNKELANKYLNEGYVVLFAAGIGKPNFTTDTCAAQRAIDIKADMILAGKNGVDGVYTDDPNINKNAKFIKNISYSEIINKELKIMDLTATRLLVNTKIVTRIFSMDDCNNFLRVIDGENLGTTIKEN